jgi:hypothetical protein
MLKLRVDMEGDAFDVEILENDRGQWELRNERSNLELGCFHLVGFDAENCITVHVSGMQDGTHSVAVVHNVVDNPIIVKKGSASRPAQGRTYTEQLSEIVNSLIADACDYPEEL